MHPDPDFQIIAGIAASLQTEYLSDEGAWQSSPFGWIRRMSSIKVRGTIGEQLVAGWLAARGFNVNRSPDPDSDRIIEGKRFEIKFAMLGKSNGFVFNQFRDQNYDAALCIGICPHDARCWVIPKQEAMSRVETKGGLRKQHDPRNPDANTYMLTVSLKKPREWLGPLGGSLSDGMRRVSEITGYTPKLLDN